MFNSIKKAIQFNEKQFSFKKTLSIQYFFQFNEKLTKIQFYKKFNSIKNSIQ